MRSHTPSYSFSGVDVSIPSGVRSSEAEEEWQEVDWVKWSLGDLTVDADTFLLVFKHRATAAGGTVKATPLGVLVRASAGGDEEGRTLVITTSDAVSKLYRCSFQSAKSATEFGRLAEQAEVAQTTNTGQDARQSEEAAAEAQSQLEAAVRAALATAAPPDAPPALLFGGAELCGPDPNFAGGSEVLLGRGVAVLTDPPEDGRVGRYELIFYGEDEGASEPVAKFQIGPKTSLKRLPPEANAVAGSDEVIFEVRTIPGAQAHSLAFGSAGVADAFARDFRVRLRLMELSLKTVRGKQAVQNLQGEVEGLLGEVEGQKRRTFCSQLQFFILMVFLLILLGLAVQIGLMYQKDKGARKPMEYVEAVVKDSLTVGRLFGKLSLDLGAKVCQAGLGAVPAAELRRCLDLAAGAPSGAGKALRLCVEQLAGPEVA